MALLSIASPSVHAEQSDVIHTEKSFSQFVKDSYIVTFKKPGKGSPPIVKPLDRARIAASIARGEPRVPFGEHSTGQSRQEIAKKIGLNGKVISIFDAINAIHVKMDAKEADRLSRNKRVLIVEQDRISIAGSTTQNNPGWGLDRIDSQTVNLDNAYTYDITGVGTGAGRTIYVLDSGLNLDNPKVAAEFGSRASVFWDVNPGGSGNDCDGHGHGSKVSSAAAGNTYGVAKGATLIMAKITNGCTASAYASTSASAFNWLAGHAPAGTIVNWSRAYVNEKGACTPSISITVLEKAIRAAHNAGIIVVVAAGNDGCDTANFSPTNIPEAFVVGATSNARFAMTPAVDAKRSSSRTGTNISAFAPGQNVPLMGMNGEPVFASGTSFAAPYIAGIFAIACQAAGTLCDTTPTDDLYEDLRETGTLGTVTNTDGTPLTGATSRFISQQW